MTKTCSKCKLELDDKCFRVRKNGNINKQCIKCCENNMKYLKEKKCEHGMLNKSACRKCNGNSWCEHGKIRTYCRDCSGGSVCEHKYRRDRCRICLGNQFCVHGSFRTSCIECDGGSICEHKSRRSRCKMCNVNGYIRYISDVRVKNALKGIFRKKEDEVIKYLGCNIDTYRKYLESKFLEGMSWENHGFDGWHIDHIIPVMYNNPTKEQVIERLHYKNTQPLWAFDNLSKGNRYISEAATGSCPSEEGVNSVTP